MQDVLGALLTFVPLMGILWLANLADRQASSPQGEGHRALTWISFVVLISLYLLLIGAGLLLQGVGALAGRSDMESLRLKIHDLGLDEPALLHMGLGLWLPSLGGIILLSSPLRRLLARLIPIDPTRATHAVSLSYVALIVVNLLVTLGLGLHNLSGMLEQSLGQNYNPAPGLWAQNILWMLMALVGVGFLSRRNLGSAFGRLAIRLPSWRNVLAGIGIGLVLAPAVLAVEAGAGLLGIRAGPDVEKLTEQLIGPLARSIPGVLTLGLAAALGEESIFRGALLPRFGLIFTTALFALMHSNYGITFATGVVFVVGLVLGLVRQRANTTTAMFVHATYNMALGFVTYLGLNF